MPKYDAFGREIGEDTLAGWRSGEAVERPAAEPEPAEAATAPPQPEPEPTVTAGPPPQARPPMPILRPRRRRRGPLITLLIVAGVVIFAGNIVSGISDEVAKNVPDFEFQVPDVDVPEAPADAPPPVGLGGESMIRPAGLRKAIADLEGRQLGVETWTFRLAPERIDATFVKKGLRHVQLRFDGTFQRFSVSRGNYAHLPTVNISELDVRAPQRLVRAAARRIGKPTSRIDYLIPQTDGWIAYFKGGQYFKGDRHGRALRRIS